MKGGNQPNIAGQELMCGREYEWQLFGWECQRCSFSVIVCLLSSKLFFPFFLILLSHFLLLKNLVFAPTTVKLDIMYSCVQYDTFEKVNME